MIKAFEGQIFVLRNADIVFVAKGAKVAQIDEAVQKLRFLFGDDPLTQYSDERDSTGFCTWYRLDYDYTRFLSVVRHIHEISELSREDAPHEDFSGGADHRTPLHPAQLGKLEDALGNTDLSNVIRNQAVCTLFPGQPPQQIFQELYVSITDL